ncbi:hypothetical protein [Pelagicoccus sp. SDUM812003]|nr:hypothetical protein [Pelagicoccus sp. SDUM812003]MDQ8203979.1 hypothetical protein [Pelagicoccus sp. SDUM812003]
MAPKPIIHRLTATDANAARAAIASPPNPGPDSLIARASPARGN